LLMLSSSSDFLFYFLILSSRLLAFLTLTFLTECLSPNAFQTTPINTANIPTMTTEESVNFHPSKVQSKITITGFKSGEAIKNDIEGPNGALDDNNPAKIGIVE